MKREEIIRSLMESMIKCEICWIIVYIPGYSYSKIKLKNDMYVMHDTNVSETWSVNAYCVRKEKIIRYNNGYIKTETNEIGLDSIIECRTKNNKED